MFGLFGKRKIKLEPLTTVEKDALAKIRSIRMLPEVHGLPPLDDQTVRLATVAASFLNLNVDSTEVAIRLADDLLRRSRAYLNEQYLYRRPRGRGDVA